MKILTSVCLAILLSVFVPLQVSAAEKFIDLEDGDAISLRAEIGVGEYWGNFDESNSSDGSDIVFTYSDLTVGGTLFKGRYFLDGYVRTSIADLGSDWKSNDTGESWSSDDDISRWEINITNGYMLTESLSVFLGLRYAVTDAEQKLDLGLLYDKDDFEFKTLGATLGLKKGWVVNKNVFGLLGGVTYAQGDLDRQSFSGKKVSGKPDSWGVVLGGQYRYLYSDNIDFSVTVDAYHLDFGTVDGYDISEETASVRFGVNYTW